jgi:uncharacterized membrane protein
MNPHKRANFISLVIVTVASILFAFFGHDGLLKTLFTLPLVLILPGYSAMAAWFPQRLMKFPGNALFVITLSLCITSLMGLVLNATPWGINRQTWIVSLGGLTLINLAIALVVGDFRVSKPGEKPLNVPLYQGALLIFAFVISLFAVEMGRQGAHQQQRTADITQLWMLPGKGANDFKMGVTSLDFETVDYKLVIKDGSRTIEETFQLKPNETWEKDFNLPGSAVREVNAYLSRVDKPHLVERSTSLWLPHTE